MSRPSCQLLPIGWIMLLIAGQVHADNRRWPYYGADEFDSPNLRRCWKVQGTEATLAGGRLQLTNDAATTGSVALKGLYQVSEPRIYLEWPWVAQTVISMKAARSDGSPVHAGLMIVFGDDSGWTACLEAGVIGVDGSYQRYARLNAQAVTLDANPIPWNECAVRIEGVGDDQQSLKITITQHADDPGEAGDIATFKLDRKTPYARLLALRNGPSPIGSPPTHSITAFFESVRFEGPSFDPGVYHRDGSTYLTRLSPEQKKALDAFGLTVDYGRKNITPVTEPVLRGERVSAQVPDTLDFAERMELSINAVTEIVDRSAGCEPYSHFYANPWGWGDNSPQYNPDMERRPPVFLHDYHGYNTGIGEGTVEIVPLLRLATGSTLNTEVSQTLFDHTRQMIGEDGLPRFPLAGRPWALFTAWWINNPVTGVSPEPDLSMTGGYAWGRFLSTLSAWYAATGSEVLKQEIEQMAAAFDRQARAHPTAALGPTIEFGLVQAWKLAGCVTARDLAARVLAETRRRQFQPDGSFSGHFHGTTFSLLAMTELAASTGDHELLEFTRKSYEFARRQGWPIVGFYPESVAQNPPNQESCSFTHMPKIAQLISEAGLCDYWDDVDCLARNQMVENQLTDARWIEDLCAKIPDANIPSPPGYDGTRDVGRRLIGGFASYASLNDFFKSVIHAPGPIVGCCTGNGAESLYYVWRSILTDKSDGLFVNLLLNRASTSADVDSCIPYEGRVDVRMKKERPLFVRMPGWVALDQVKCTVNGETRSLTWRERYASPGVVAAGATASFQFPLQERVERLKIGEVDAELTIRGATVVAISPKGENGPLYQGREKYRTGKTQWKTVQRYVPDREVNW